MVSSLVKSYADASSTAVVAVGTRWANVLMQQALAGASVQLSNTAPSGGSCRRTAVQSSFN